MGNFTEVSGTPFEKVRSSSIAFIDVDGDKDQDVLISGFSSNNTSIAKLYKNSENSCSSSSAIDTQVGCGSGYTWIDGNTYYQPTNRAIFPLTNTAGCDSVVTLNLTLEYVGDTSAYVSGTTITATNNNATFKWLDCDNNLSVIEGENNQSFTATRSGNYSVEIKENGCTYTSRCFSILTVGLSENDYAATSLYPNPNNGIFTIDLGKNYENTELKVLDISGHLVHSLFLESTNKLKINLNEPAGIYFIELKYGDQEARFKLVIK